MSEPIYSVSEINLHIKDLLDGDPVMAGLYVRGELSNYKMYPSGHHYFTMKDAEGALRCVMFRSSAQKLKFRPENGMKVVAFGRISVYPRDGAYQLYVNQLSADGLGDLHVAFEQLKQKLYAEGLFDADHKKPIPRFPGRIAVITSSAGAAVRDVIRVLRKRYPLAKVIVMPVRVQGTEAPPEIVGAIRYANRHQVADLLIVGRGGGSIEDLWAFNDENVARAIYASQIPVISAVGHEPDFTIADFVADLRAATPSNGAELAVPDRADLLALLDQYETRSAHTLTLRLENYEKRLEELAGKRVMQDPKNYVQDKQMTLDFLSERLSSAMERTVGEKSRRFAACASKLDALSPLKVLGRGYCIATGTDGGVVRSAGDVKRGDTLTLRLQNDQIDCKVEDVHNG